MKTASIDNAEKQKAFAAIFSYLEYLESSRSISTITHKSPKSLQTVQRILNAAHEKFTAEGHVGLSLRTVAERANVSVGNLTYHFPTKGILIKEMLHYALERYLRAHLEQIQDNSDTALDILLNVVGYYVRHSADWHRFFCHMWSYAGSSEDAKVTIREMHRPIGRFIYYLIRAANPDINDAEIRQKALQIFSLTEGYKLFIGMGPSDSLTIQTAENDIRALAKHIVMKNPV